MDARALANARVMLGAVALAACVTLAVGAVSVAPLHGWHLAALAVAALASLSLLSGFHARAAALVAAVALGIASPAHPLLRLVLALFVATDAGARASIDVVRDSSRARARVAVAPILVVLGAAAIALMLGAAHRTLSSLDVAAAVATAFVLVPGRAFDALAGALAERIAPIDVIYDGKCSFCRSSVDTLLALDVLARLQPRDSHAAETRAAHPDLDPERAQRELLVFHGKRLEGGFDALRSMAWKLPVAWIVVPLLYLPPVPQLGRPIYRLVAANRLKIACELNLAPPSRPTVNPSARPLPAPALALLVLAAAALETLLALGLI